MTDFQQESDKQNESNEDTQKSVSVGIVRELGDLPPGTIVSEEGLARIFDRHPVSIKRAIQRGELPPPTRLFGGSVWIVDTILNHIGLRLEDAKKDFLRDQKKIQGLRP